MLDREHDRVVEAGLAGAARQLRHAGAGLLEALVDVRDRRQPLLREQVGEQRAFERGLRFAAVRPVGLPGDAPPSR